LYIDEIILERGRNYHKSSNIIHIEYSRNEWVADVKGSDDYTVFVTLSDENDIINAECDCPFDWSEYCKHKVAVLYAIRNKFESGAILAEPVEKKNIKGILQNLNKQTLMSIILELAEKDLDIKENILLQYTNNEKIKISNAFKRRKTIENRIINRTVNTTNSAIKTMDWQKCMNQAIDYIENNLTGEIDYSLAAQHMSCSVWEFQRLFSLMAKVPLSDYIRQRRLTLAAQDIQISKDKIIEVAFRYGYDSPASFSRAFNQMHGTTPKSARDSGVVLKIFPRLNFQLAETKVDSINYRIEEKEHFQVLGITKCYNDDDVSSGSIGRLWYYWNDNKLKQKLHHRYGKGELHEMCVSFPSDTIGEFYYTVGVLYNGIENIDEYNIVTIAGGTYAVFDIPDEYVNDVGKFMGRCVSEYIPAAGYEMAWVDAEYFPDRKNGEAWFLLKDNQL